MEGSLYTNQQWGGGTGNVDHEWLLNNQQSGHRENIGCRVVLKSLYANQSGGYCGYKYNRGLINFDSHYIKNKTI